MNKKKIGNLKKNCLISSEESLFIEEHLLGVLKKESAK